MESMKRNWGKPGLDVQMFTPEEYCHSCWSVLCNYQGYAFQDRNGSGNFDVSTELVHSNDDHTPAELVILKDGESPAQNCFASKSRHMTGGGFFSDPVPDGASYSGSSFIPAFWFKATRNGVEAARAEHINDLTPGSYWPYKDANGRERPNHS